MSVYGPVQPAHPTRPQKGFTGSLVKALILIAALCAGSALLLYRLDLAYPPPLDRMADYSVEVVDRNDKPLRIFANKQDRWRLKTDLTNVDPRLVKILIAYEDKRFYNHIGVDPIALVRAAGQFLSNGKIVSGGSTLTMQLARLLEPRAERTISAKILQIARALQIERRLSKREILENYLTLAPYGGNIEGVRAASLSWFGREPKKLALREAALLVALPQSPERRRPDRFPTSAKKARDRVLLRLAAANILSEDEAVRVASLAVPNRRLTMPMQAPHLAAGAIDRDPLALRHTTRLDALIQEPMQALARESAQHAGRKTSVAIVVADALSGDILASVGSSDIHDESRRGWIDMTRAPRSPGSTLKPFVYGLAIEDGLVRPASMISDRPSDFGGYRPTNFDLTYQGDVSVRKALQMSLNVPAVKLLDAVSPARLVSRMKRAGVTVRLPEGEIPGLGLVLGGAGITLTELVQLYANLASPRHKPIALGDGIRSKPGSLNGQKLLSPVSAWHVVDMLSGIRQPVGSKSLAIAYKTGTSYGYRDAWSIGFDGQHVIGVWVGRADNGPVPGITGIKTAAPILFRAFEKSRISLVPFAPAPEGALREVAGDLPVSLKVFENRGAEYRFANIAPSNILKITFPAHGNDLEMAKFADGSNAPIVVQLQGGIPPYRLMENQVPVDKKFRRRQVLWTPKSKGTTQLVVVDSVGQAQSIEVMIR